MEVGQQDNAKNGTRRNAALVAQVEKKFIDNEKLLMNTMILQCIFNELDKFPFKFKYCIFINFSAF